MSFWSHIRNLAAAKSAAPEEPQTVRFASLRGEFAGHPSRGMTPALLAGILEQAEQGNLTAQHDLALDMEEKDTHIYAELYKRKMSSAQLDWSIDPPRNPSAKELKRAAALEELLRDALFDMEDVAFDLADGILHGFSCLEFDGWERIGTNFRPKGLVHRPQSWFTVDRKTRSRLLLRASSEAEGELQPFGWVVHVHRAKSGYIARGGLARILGWPFLYKNYSIRDLAEFLEIYGIPARIGKYPTGTTEADKATLLSAVTQLGHSAAGIMPENMILEFMAAASGQADPFQAMMSWCDRAESKAILGGTLTSEPGDVGSRSLGQVHDEVRNEIRNHDARQLASSLTRYLVWPMAQLNGLAEDPKRMPRLIYDTGAPEDLALYADSLPKLVGVGMKIPHSWAREKLRIPEPEGDEPLLETSSPLPQPIPAGTPADGNPPGTAAASVPLVDTPDPGPVTDYTDRLQSETRDAMAGILAVIEQAIADGEDLTSLQDKLLSMFGQLDSTQLEKIMSTAFACADLAGRVDVAEGR